MVKISEWPSDLAYHFVCLMDDGTFDIRIHRWFGITSNIASRIWIHNQHFRNHPTLGFRIVQQQQQQQQQEEEEEEEEKAVVTNAWINSDLLDQTIESKFEPAGPGTAVPTEDRSG